MYFFLCEKVTEIAMSLSIPEIHIISTRHKTKRDVEGRTMLVAALMSLAPDAPSHPCMAQLFREWADRNSYEKYRTPDQSMFSSIKKKIKGASDGDNVPS